MDRVEIFIFYNFSLIKETASPYSYIHSRLPVKMSGMELIFQEENFLVKKLTSHEDMEAALRLRHDIFREELKWVPPLPDGLDRDEYDAFAHSLGIFEDRGELVGHVRLIPAPLPYMIEKDFACLLPKDKPFKKVQGMAESTRICVKKEFRKTPIGTLTLAHLLYKAIYHWCLIHDTRYLVTIIEQRYYIYLKRFFPFEQVGDFLPLGDGVMSGIVLLDWRAFESKASQHRPEFFNWISNLPPLVPSRSLQHGFY